MGETPELLAPAGGPEQLLEAIHFGADAVYLAGPRWGMRARARNFTIDELEHAIATAHASGVKVHVTVNTVMHDEDLDELPAYLEQLEGAGADALIVGDVGAMRLARRYAPSAELHVSTQANVMNAEAAKAYQELGASRIVCAREMTIGEIARMREKLPQDLELEAFAHGSLCLAYAGRCLLSAALMGRARSASEGACAQPCRWGWALADERAPERRLPIEEDAGASYILSSNDLCMIEHIDELREAGVSSLKLEGRNKGSYYVACITNAYRHVLDGEDVDVWREELDHVSHRPYSTGFYFGDPEQNPGRVDYARDRRLIGIVDSCDEAEAGYLASFKARNRLAAETPVCVLAPKQPVRTFEPSSIELWDREAGCWKPSDTVSLTMERYRISVPFALSPSDVLAQDA